MDVVFERKFYGRMLEWKRLLADLCLHTNLALIEKVLGKNFMEKKNLLPLKKYAA